MMALMPNWDFLSWMWPLFSSLFSGVVGAVIGGWMTSRSAIRAQKQAAEDQRQRDEEAERRAINGTLRAIKTELETFQNALVKETDEKLKKWEKQTPLDLPSITQNYFIVFDASASALGRIENDDLRERILGAFYEAKRLIEAINSLHQQYQSYEPLSRAGQALDSHQKKQLDTLIGDLIVWTNVDIPARLLRLQEKVPSVLNDIEKHLAL